MNLAVGTILLSVVLMSMLLFCCAHAADNQTIKQHRETSRLRHNRPPAIKIEKLGQQVRPDESLRAVPAHVPMGFEQPEIRMDRPTEPQEISIQLKGVRG